MAIVTCSYCGTEYDKREGTCPRCGKINRETTQRVSRSQTNSKPAADAVPRWMWIVTCVVLSIAVLIGVAAFVVKMGFLDGTFSLAGPALTLNEDNAQNAAAELPSLDTQADAEPVVADGACVDLTLNHEQIVLERQGQRVFLSAVPRPAECEEEIVFESMDSEIAAISASGLVEALAPGETEIIVTCGEISKSCSIVCDFEVLEESDEEETDEEVTDDESSDEETEEDEAAEEEATLPPEVTPADFTLFYYGEKARLSLKNIPDGAVVTYTSSNPAVVSVTADGTVEAKMNQPGTLYGMAEITIMVNDVKLTSTARCDYSGTAEE